MKRILGMLLAFMLCISLCACGADPLENECADIEEVVKVLAENYTDPKTQYETVKANPSIYQYFQRDHVSDEIWKKLKDATDESGNAVFTMSEINSLYNVCNQTNGFDDWFEFINVGSDGIDEPFIMWSTSRMTVDKLTDSIKNKFKDPDSVSIKNAWICFALPEDAGSSDSFTVYDEDCRYVILAEVQAKNGFGALDTSVCRIEGNVGWTFSVKETSLSSSLLTRPALEIDGYGAWSRIF